MPSTCVTYSIDAAGRCCWCKTTLWYWCGCGCREAAVGGWSSSCGAQAVLTAAADPTGRLSSCSVVVDAAGRPLLADVQDGRLSVAALAALIAAGALLLAILLFILLLAINRRRRRLSKVQALHLHQQGTSTRLCITMQSSRCYRRPGQ